MSAQAQQIYFEEELARNPYQIKTWWNYLQFRQDAKPGERFLIFERAVKCLPRSYKLWHAYLQERTKHVRGRSVKSSKFHMLINAYERALMNLNKMPRIWLDYCELLMSLHKGTQTRHTFDRALKSLPVTQHEELWNLYIEWAIPFGINDTAVRVYRRFLTFDPSSREGYIEYLESTNQFEEAARQLSACLNDETFLSPSGQTHHQMWMHLCDICAKHPEDVVNTVNVEAMIRSGIHRFSDEVGRLWNSLADYYIRLGQFERARDVYEEAIGSVVTVRDFTTVFDAYVKVEESVLTTKINFLQSQEDDGELADAEDETADINMRLSRIEHLMDRRPLLLNSVILRQNPHNVHEWQKRVKLCKGNQQKTITTYAEAIKTIDPQQAVGKLSGMWIGFSRYYEEQVKDLDSARNLLQRATEVNFKTVDELANVWCAWGEMEMRHELYDRALKVMQQAVLEPVLSVQRRKAMASAVGKGKDAEQFEGAVVADRLYKNVKVWSLYLDLEESLGSVESCRAAYERVIELKVVTAQMILNCASFLEENNYFEDSFKMYEKGVALFTYPQVKALWVAYLDKFMERYGGTKLERLRDLFEQAVSKVPAEDAVEFYIKYAKMEEKYGLPRHVMAVFDRATKAVPESQLLDMFRLYIKKAEQFFGATKTRPIYEAALNVLSDEQCKALCLEFMQMERTLGEIDRARAVLQYGSQFADPRKDPNYWLKWREFEESHGNEDTFREMLRVHRSVETSFAQVHYLAVDMLHASQPATDTAVPVGVGMEALERSVVEEAQQVGQKRKLESDGENEMANKFIKNTEEIDI